MGADYAARAILDLAQRYGAGPIHSSEIAQRQRIPESFLEQIMTALRKAGIVHSSRGPRGGHYLALPPHDISLRAVVEAVEGPMGCSPDQPDTASACGVLRDVWCELDNAYGEWLGQMTFDLLVERNEQQQTRAAYSI